MCLNYEKPVYDRFWDGTVSDLFPYDVLFMLEGSIPGCGFSHVPGGLTEQLITTCEKLNTIDQLTNHYRHPRPVESDFNEFSNFRDATLHQLMSIPAWEEMDSIERGTSYEPTHETCRLTTMLYSNAVLLALPPHLGWHKRIVDKLQRILETSCLRLSGPKTFLHC